MANMWRHLLVIVVVLHTAHVPVPVPDLDGEWQGLAIGGFADPAAWGFVLLGVLPADDVDRGPIKHDIPGDTTDPAGQPFGDAAIAGNAGASHVLSALRRVGGLCVPAMLGGRSEQPTCLASTCTKERDRGGMAHVSPTTARASLCVWHI